MTLTINGRPIDTTADPAMRLLDFLREHLLLKGTKEGCGKGECGACTVVLDGRVVDSCLVLLGQCDSASVTTIEGVGAGGEMSPVQRAFVEHGAVQCGFCTPGLVLAAETLLADNPDPAPEDVRRAMEGNLCRCTGWVKVEAAVLAAARASIGADGCSLHATGGGPT